MKNSTLIRLIQQSIRHYNLDLSGYNVLLPSSLKIPALNPIMASLAGAENIYVAANDIETVNNVSIFENEFKIKSHITFIEKESPQILSNLDIVIFGENISYIDKQFASSLKQDCVISVLPQNLDFNNITGINLEDCSKNQIPVVTVNPVDKNLMLYKYFAHIIFKRCYEANIDIFRSRILLVSNGELLENLLSLFKTMGSQVYAARTDRAEDAAYILKHLSEVDAMIIADYPQKSSLVVGNAGFVRIDDLLEINPDIKIVHFCGKVQANALTLSRISYVPNNITQNSLNFTINDLGSRIVIDSTAAAMKAAESLIKIKSRTILPNESTVAYNIVNADGPVILGKIPF